MAIESIGALYPTKIPGFADSADIQKALRVYHYGSDTYSPGNTDPAQIPTDSVAGKLKAIEAAIVANTGSVLLATAPTSPVNGYIWVDSSAATAKKPAYIWNSATSAWVQISGGVELGVINTWTAAQNFSDAVTVDGALVSKFGINNFLNYTARDAAFPTPQNGTICFVRQDNSGTPINQLQYYYNAWTNATAITPATPTTVGAVYGVTDTTNTAIGKGALSSNVTGTGNVAIGLNAGSSETGSDKLYVGSTPLVKGDFSKASMFINGALVENVKVIATAPGVTNYLSIVDDKSTVMMYTANMTSGWGLYLRGNASVTFNSLFEIGQSITVACIAKQGSTGYPLSGLYIDGTQVTVKWQNGVTPIANTNSFDMYNFNVIKTADATFTVFGNMVKFA